MNMIVIIITNGKYATMVRTYIYYILILQLVLGGQCHRPHLSEETLRFPG